MNGRLWTGFMGAVVLACGLSASANLQAEGAVGDGYSIEDLRLHTAGELIDTCAIDAGHEHYEVARAFCFGFFEGATRYHDAIARTPSHVEIVCEPPDVTRSQAVDVFIQYMQANPQYGQETPVNAIFRAQVDKWPCDG